ncbi:MAG: membrane lipoprotein lipid attachment site-containing protein [Clostridia bacterium]|jgi:hypothetical protein|nr:membrane lipoprotein lipid attachment site-containing protein [Clostridia bacterium]
MKKFVLFLGLVLMLSGCGTSVSSNSSAVTSQTSASSFNVTSVNAQNKIDSETSISSSSSATSSSERPLTKESTFEDFESYLDLIMQMSNYAPITEWSRKRVQNEYTNTCSYDYDNDVNNMKDSDLSLVVFLNDDNTINYIMLSFVYDGQFDERTKTFMNMALMLLLGYEKDDNNIDKTLKFGNFSENRDISAKGKNAEFEYFVKDGFVSFEVDVNN